MADSAVFLDTNVLLIATTPARPFHAKAVKVLSEWPSRGLRLCTSGQVLREYLAVATRPRQVNGLGLTPSQAVENVATFRSRLVLLDEGEAVVRQLATLVSELACRGKQVHDANIVATALVHGASWLVTANVVDFQRFRASLEILDLASADDAPSTAASS